jgi:hypothetical protein
MYSNNPNFCNWLITTVYKSLHKILYDYNFIHNNVQSNLTPILAILGYEITNVYACQTFVRLAATSTSSGMYRFYGATEDLPVFVKSTKLASSRVIEFNLGLSYQHHLSELAASAAATSAAATSAAAATAAAAASSSTGKRVRAPYVAVPTKPRKF